MTATETLRSQLRDAAARYYRASERWVARRDDESEAELDHAHFCAMELGRQLETYGRGPDALMSTEGRWFQAMDQRYGAEMRDRAHDAMKRLVGRPVTMLRLV